MASNWQSDEGVYLDHPYITSVQRSSHCTTSEGSSFQVHITQDAQPRLELKLYKPRRVKVPNVHFYHGWARTSETYRRLSLIDVVGKIREKKVVGCGLFLKGFGHGFPSPFLFDCPYRIVFFLSHSAAVTVISYGKQMVSKVQIFELSRCLSNIDNPPPIPYSYTTHIHTHESDHTQNLITPKGSLTLPVRLSTRLLVARKSRE